MSANSNNKGRAYEYAWINALYKALSAIRTTRIVNNSSLDANKKAWKVMDNNVQKLFKISADSAVDTILELEPCMSENDGSELVLEFQKDNAGVHGDVRDIIIKRDNIEWEIGLSIKHNHDAIKHSRLSHGLDFGAEWFGVPCSKEYWTCVKPIFDKLKEEKDKGKKWSELSDKADEIYIPLLKAFMAEVKSMYKKDVSVLKKMIEYLIGIKDYYKIVSHDNKHMTLIYTFNMHGTLNKPSKIKISTFCVPTTKLPTEMVALKIKNKSSNTVEMYLNNGWQLSFRIHNASTLVEPSLKFDIQFVGMPISILNIECKWSSE